MQLKASGSTSGFEVIVIGDRPSIPDSVSCHDNVVLDAWLDAVMSSSQLLPYEPYLHPAARASKAALSPPAPDRDNAAGAAAATSGETSAAVNAAGRMGLEAVAERSRKRARLDVGTTAHPPVSGSEQAPAVDGSSGGMANERGVATSLAVLSSHVLAVTPTQGPRPLPQQHAARLAETTHHHHQQQQQQEQEQHPASINALEAVRVSSTSPGSSLGLERPLRPQGLTRMPSSEQQAPARWFVPAIQLPGGVPISVAAAGGGAAATGVGDASGSGLGQSTPPAVAVAATGAAAPVALVAATGAVGAAGPVAAVASMPIGIGAAAAALQEVANTCGAAGESARGGICDRKPAEGMAATATTRSSRDAFTVVTYNMLAQKFVG